MLTEVANMGESLPEKLSRLWEDFRKLPFPADFYSREPAGECMVSMDASLAGCISSAMNGRLDEARHEVLHGRIVRLREILPLIQDDENASSYFTHLYEIAILAAKIDDRHNP
ncbi:hypothetical protein [Streptomyces sp. NPDC053728]|uniref:hypothetical protein n=1 Tax=Streptomyces sp. NPDC053728 TaxID=3155534 RepID=UPI00341E639F